jgi:glycerol-3-phosphate dehydrogenase
MTTARSSATAATRDYVLKVDAGGGAPVLNVFGGKITTYRRLAESALGRKAGGHGIPGLAPLQARAGRLDRRVGVSEAPCPAACPRRFPGPTA